VCGKTRWPILSWPATHIHFVVRGEARPKKRGYSTWYRKHGPLRLLEEVHKVKVTKDTDKNALIWLEKTRSYLPRVLICWNALQTSTTTMIKSRPLSKWEFGRHAPSTSTSGLWNLTLTKTIIKRQFHQREALFQGHQCYYQNAA
jgi:hypothetical protein